MGRDMFPALSGGVRALQTLDILANNLANLETTGFKADRPVFRLHAADHGRIADRSSAEARLASAFATLDEAKVDWSQGNLQQTGADSDLALAGDGFFAVQDGAGITHLTRDGSFAVDEQGFLSTRGGLRLLGLDGQPLSVAGNGPFEVDRAGNVAVDGATRGTIAVVDVPDRDALEKEGANLWKLPPGTATQPVGAEVVQRHLEGSNVQPVSALTQLIAASRYYEAFEKSLETSSQLDQNLSSRVGRIDQ
jgi:flagellar basal-body rod protein FlgG